MKKKHRDITVDGVQYGWTVDYRTRLKIWKDKKVIAEHNISELHDITPSIVAALIKEPEITMLWVNSPPCPFCGNAVERVEHNDYFVCRHDEECWIYTTGTPISVISQAKIEIWETRNYCDD